MPVILAKRPGSVSRRKWEAYLALEDPFRAGPVARSCGVGLVALIVLNAFMVGVTNQEVPADLQGLVFGFGVASTLAFAVEYGCRIWVADLMYPQMRPLRARLRYMLSLMGLIDLLAVVPAVALYLVPASAAPRDAVRIIRLVRLIKLSRYMLGLQSIERVFVKRRQEIVAAFMILALLTVASSVLMYDAEHSAQPDRFDSVLTGLYWAMTTITTTGYGDLVPVTPLGRLVGFVVMVLAIGAVAIPAGIFSAGFMEEFRTERHSHGHGHRHRERKEGYRASLGGCDDEGPQPSAPASGPWGGEGAGAGDEVAEERASYAVRETFDEFAAASPVIPYPHLPEDASLSAPRGGSIEGSGHDA